MRNYIIGIAGAKNSGKDTIASMINYIFKVGVTVANYNSYILNKDRINFALKDRIIHFGDAPKDILSIMFNIPRKYFDDRIYKDVYWYNLRAGYFANIDKNRIASEVLLTIKDLEKGFTIPQLIDNYGGKHVYIKLRTLMQYFATNICKSYFGEDIWVRSAMSKIVDIAESRRLCIVPDVRFANEAEDIMTDSDSLYGVVIKVKRDTDVKPEHCSEIIDFKCDFEIDNNSNLFQLFYKVLNICQTLK